MAKKKVVTTSSTATTRVVAVVTAVRVIVPFVPKEWRKQYGSDTWHFHPACSNWPQGDVKVRTEKPTNGELCDQCLAKAKEGA